MERDFDDCCRELSRRKPNLSLAIHRLALRDPQFRAICGDYGEAVRAAEAHGEAHGSNRPIDVARAEEFQQLAQDLLTEAFDYLIEHFES